MAKTKVLLLEPVDNLGGEGDIVTVAAGYARNFLLRAVKGAKKPRAVDANGSNRKQIEVLQERRKEREARERANAEELKAKIEALSIAIPVKTAKQGENVQIFGSVNTHTLVQRLKEEGIELLPKQFHLGEAIKSLGKFDVKVKLAVDVFAVLPFEVVSENPIEETAEA